MHAIVIVRFVLLAGVLITPGLFACDAGSNELSDFSPLVSSLKVDPALDFCGRKVPFENHEVRERFEKELLLTLWNRPQVILWLKRSRRYLPYIEQMLKDNGLPEDIKYVAVAESALLPHAGSSRGARGFWQFMAETGRKFGLVIDAYVDERRNLFASTAAAVCYFNDLFQKFESWELAAAAYNMGEEGLMAEIMEQETNDYYRLYLPLETQRYIFRILSVKLILQDPEKYGFNLADDEYYPPFTFDTVQVDCRQEIPVRIVAQAANTYFKVIKDLNPAIRGHYLREGTHKILIPEGAAKGFQDRYTGLADTYISARKGKGYIVKKGDNLSSIAEKFNVPLAALIIWNRIDLKKPIHPGQRLIIYADEVTTDETEIREEEGASG